MAGAGYKLFNTGDVLTAAQVNTYLQEQTVMVFNDATARTTALSGVLAEGMVTYLKSTKVVEIYNGTAWASLDDPNAIQNTIVDAKGDLITATASDVPARLAVGNNGETLVADSSATTGLRWQGDYAAGKNKIINGNMLIDQRNSGAAVTVNAAAAFYCLDRWRGFGQATDGVFTLQQDSSAPAGFDKSLKATVTTADASIGATQSYSLTQFIEGYNMADLSWGTADARTVTLSFWVRSSLTGTFGGSLRNGALNRSYPFSYSISAADTWEKKTITITGDTTGTWLKDNGVGVGLVFGLGQGADFVGTAGSWVGASRIGVTGQTQLIGTLNATWYLTGVQFEIGSAATTFQTATGTLGGELAACRRYLPAISGLGSNLPGAVTSTTGTVAFYSFDVPARVAPTGLTFSALSDFSVYNKLSSFANPTAIALNTGGVNNATIVFTTTAGSPTLVAGETAQIYSNGSGALILLTGCEL